MFGLNFKNLYLFFFSKKQFSTRYSLRYLFSLFTKILKNADSGPALVKSRWLNFLWPSTLVQKVLVVWKFFQYSFVLKEYCGGFFAHPPSHNRCFSWSTCRHVLFNKILGFLKLRQVSSPPPTRRRKQVGYFY